MPFCQLSNLFKRKNKDVRQFMSNFGSEETGDDNLLQAMGEPLRAAPSKTINATPPCGLITCSEGVDPSVDIIAIHGLDGHCEKSWTTNHVNWLCDLLPIEIPNARILSWGYDARTHSISHIGGKYIYDHGTTLVSDLSLKRALTKTETRPIIFIAHSLGGIVLKSALIHSEAARKDALEEHRSIKLSTYGIIFMGTPHLGAAGVELGEMVLRMASVFIKTDNRAVRHIERGSEWLQQQDRQYAPISRDFVTKFAYELFPTMSIALGKKIMVVPQASAVVPGTTDGEPIAIPADHVNMVKFASRQDVGYQKVAGQIQIMAERALDIIRARWDEQDRIQDVLAKRNDEFSISFSLYGVPETEEFVGRKDELGKINEAFQGDGSERKIVVLQGLGGIGKTQLAVKYLKDHRDNYSAILWMNGSSEDILKQSFAVAAKRLYKAHKSSAVLRIAAEAQDINEVVASLRQWLSIKENNRWMIVFDNIDNPKLPGNKDPQAYDIKAYFPEAHHGSIMITTRSSRLKIGRVMPVRKLLDPGECISILSSMSGRLNLDQDTYANEVARKLDGLPLALATAGAYISQVPISLEKYLRYYTDSWLKLQHTSPELLSYEDRTVYTTWNLSFEHIRSQNESAAYLLRLWAYFDNQDVWYELLASGSRRCPKWFSSIVGDELSFNEVIRILCDHALIEPFDGSGNDSSGYSMHNCVHAWAKHISNEEDDLQLRRIALSCVSGPVPGLTTPEYWIVERRLLPHAQKCLELLDTDIDSLSEDYQDYLVDIYWLGNIFSKQGQLKEAESIYRRALKCNEKILGPNHLLTLGTISSLGDVYTEQGKHVEPGAMSQRALNGYENALETSHNSPLGTLLKPAYGDQYKLQLAETMYQRALDGKEKTLGQDHKSTIETVGSLGLLYTYQGKLEQAETMLRRALDSRERTLGPEHVSTLNTLNNLGNLYAEQGRLAEAEGLLRRSLNAKEKLLGPEHPLALDTINNLGDLYSDQGNLEEAVAMYRRAFEGREKMLGPEHLSTLDTIHNVGVIFTEQGKLAEAEAMLRQSLHGKEKTIGPEHLLTLATVKALGALYADQGRLEEAEVMYRRALDGRENTLGPENLSTLNTANDLGNLYAEQGKLAEAELMLRRALEGKNKMLGSDDISTLETAHTLGLLYSDQVELEKAEAMYRRALGGRERTLGPEDLSTLDTVKSLGAVYAEQGKLAEAEAMLWRAFNGMEKALGPEHRSTLDAAYALALLHENQS